MWDNEHRPVSKSEVMRNLRFVQRHFRCIAILGSVLATAFAAILILSIVTSILEN